jgi:hypothetical protein
MAINKSSFQPKDARAVDMSYRDDDEDDMSDLFPNEKSKKMMTGTQALVEFLKTSPEEFQRSTPERSVNNIFSRMRKPKRNTAPPPTIIPTPSLSSRSVPSSTASLQGTLGSTLTAPTSYHGSESGNHMIHRKNHVEIVPQQKMVTKSAGNSRSPSFDTTSVQSFVLRNSSNNNNNNKAGEPILPNKKRESSLYSGSLRHSASIRSQLSTTTNHRRPLIREPSQKLDSKVTEEYLTLADGMDTIESALLQRLERIRLVNEEIPSDQIAAGLATEHVRALGITHTLDNQQHQDSDKRKVRHMQVQTDNLSDHPSNSEIALCSKSTKDAALRAATSEDAETRAKRAEAALEEALDHFETISGLAYKKLRELWEEKMRWETACMDLRDRLLVMEQKKYPFQNGADHVISQLHHDDYFLEENEEEDELGLSEFPCSEN